jgi:DNA polymerase-1
VVADARKIPHNKLFAWLKIWWDDESITKIFHNADFDIKFLVEKGWSYELDTYGLVGTNSSYNFWDTMLAERVLTAGLQQDADLATVARKYLGIYLDKSIRKEFLDLADRRRPISRELLEYSARDVIVLQKIMEAQREYMKTSGLDNIFRLEMKVLIPSIEASLHGVEIHLERWEAHIARLQLEAEKREKELVEELQPYVNLFRKKKYPGPHQFVDLPDFEEAAGLWEVQHQRLYDEYVAEAPKQKYRKSEARKLQKEWREQHPKPIYVGGPINLGSPEQLSGSLLEVGVPLPRSQTGSAQTGKNILIRFTKEFPIVAKITEWRKYAKLVESFGASVLRLVDGRSRLHPSFKTMGADTGRFSCAGPNIQQIPAGPLGVELRHCFISPPGYRLISADYSQIELRLLAELSGEEGMLWAFDNDVDLHSLTALKMFLEVQTGVGVTAEQISLLMEQANTNRELLGQIKQILKQVKDDFDFYRKRAKTINFGIPYGQTKYGFAEGMQVSLEEADEIIQAYYRANPKIKAWLEETARFGLKHWYVKTPLGRKRFFDPLTRELMYTNRREYMRLTRRYSRMMCNMPIQAASADITKIAIVLIREALLDANLDAQQVMFIHDEIVVEVKEEQAEAAAVLVVDCMKRAARVVLERCPIDVSYKIGIDWEH